MLAVQHCVVLEVAMMIGFNPILAAWLTGSFKVSINFPQESFLSPKPSPNAFSNVQYIQKIPHLINPLSCPKFPNSFTETCNTSSPHTGHTGSALKCRFHWGKNVYKKQMVGDWRVNRCPHLNVRKDLSRAPPPPVCRLTILWIYCSQVE